MLFPHLCDIYRDTALGTNGRNTKTLHSSSQRCTFIPMTTRAEIDNGFSVGTGYDVYFPDASQDVKTGDQLRWEGGKYNIRAAHPYKVPTVGHTHCLTTREGV